MNKQFNFLFDASSEKWNSLNIDSDKNTLQQYNMFTLQATSKFGDKFRFDEWGDGEWKKNPHQEKTFETRDEAQGFIERHPFYDGSLFEGWKSIKVIEMKEVE